MSSNMSGAAGPAEVIRSRREDGPTVAVPEDHENAPVADEPVKGDRLVPTIGLRALWYRAALKVGINMRPPRLSKKERFLIAAREEAARRQAEHELRVQRHRDSIEQLRRLADQVGTATIAFFGTSGSAATTTTAVNCAAVFSERMRNLVACSDLNPASGTAAARLGKDYGDTLTVREFRRLIREKVIVDPSQLTSRMKPTVNGVRVLGANDRTSEAGEVESTILEEMLDLIGRVFEFHYVDTANDTGTASMRKILEMCDMPVFTANVDERKSLQLLGIGMEIARKVPGMLNKTNNSVVVISRLPAGADLTDYRKFLNRVNIHEQVTSPYAFYGQMLPVHESEALAHNAAVDLTRLRWDTTMQEYIDLNIAIFEQILLTRANRGRRVAQ